MDSVAVKKQKSHPWELQTGLAGGGVEAMASGPEPRGQGEPLPARPAVGQASSTPGAKLSILAPSTSQIRKLKPTEGPLETCQGPQLGLGSPAPWVRSARLIM